MFRWEKKDKNGTKECMRKIRETYIDDNIVLWSELFAGNLLNDFKIISFLGMVKDLNDDSLTNKSIRDLHKMITGKDIGIGIMSRSLAELERCHVDIDNLRPTIITFIEEEDKLVTCFTKNGTPYVNTWFKNGLDFNMFLEVDDPIVYSNGGSRMECMSIIRETFGKDRLVIETEDGLVEINNERFNMLEDEDFKDIIGNVTAKGLVNDTSNPIKKVWEYGKDASKRFKTGKLKIISKTK